MARSLRQVSYGDFQTPLALCREVVRFVAGAATGIGSVLEPTCGTGSFLQAAIEELGVSPTYLGFDINHKYVAAARRAVLPFRTARVQVDTADFYQVNWHEQVVSLPESVLVLGNPPWVTNAVLGSAGGINLPKKRNFQQHKGLAAKTGKSNFDISEWMLLELLEALTRTNAMMAMLCKISTARKVLAHAWKADWRVGPSSLHLVDAGKHFSVSVGACLLLTHTGRKNTELRATVYPGLSYEHPGRSFGLSGCGLVADIDTFRECAELDGFEYRRWRSGVKHDAIRIMEFTRQGNSYINGLDERWELEHGRLYPMLKSSNLANGDLIPKRWVLLTQLNTTEDTTQLQDAYPRVWGYLARHSKSLDGRRSSIYSGRGRFAVFGVGPYTFAPWKVAVSGFHAPPCFRVIGPHEGRPVVLDDTSYFLSCGTREEAVFYAELLNSATAQRFLDALVFPDAKRPITIDALRRVDLKRLAERLGHAGIANRLLTSPVGESTKQCQLVFDRGRSYEAPPRCHPSTRD